MVPILRKRGLKLAVASNTGYWSPQKARTLMLEDTSPFDLVVESCKLGMAKPDPRFFRTAARKLGVHPSECIFVDDSWGNCKGAEEAGMTAIHASKCRTRPAMRKLRELLGIKLKKKARRSESLEPSSDLSTVTINTDDGRIYLRRWNRALSLSSE